MVPRLKEKYESEVLPALRDSLGRENRLSLPRLEKIIVNMGVGSAITEKKHLEESVSAMTQITGQKPVVTVARKAIAGFRLSWNADRLQNNLAETTHVGVYGSLDFIGDSPCT